MINHYLATSLRHFRQNRLTATINIACLALGLTCFLLAWGTAAYYEHADRYHSRAARTYVLTESNSALRMTLQMTPWLLAEHLRAEMPELEAVARVQFPRETPLAAGDEKLFAAVGYADPQFLDIFELPFVSGQRAGALATPATAIVSEALARRLYGTTDVVGRTLQLSGRNETATITGVVGTIRRPSHIATGNPYPFGLSFEALLSMDLNRASRNVTTWDADGYYTYAVLPAGGQLTAADFNARLQSLSARSLPPDERDEITFRAFPIDQFTTVVFNTLVRADVTGVSSFMVLKLLGALVLLVASLNYTNLATAQGVMRTREIALLKVVGAARRQLILQHSLEGLLATSLALLIAFGGAALVGAGLGPGLTDLVTLFVAMPEFWLASVAVLVVVGVAASAYPAFVLSRLQPAQALRGVRGGSNRLSSLLVGAQFGSASFLLIAVLVMSQQYAQMRQAIWDPTRPPIVQIANDLAAARVDPEVLREELRRVPGVNAVTASHRTLWDIGADGDPVSTSEAVGGTLTSTMRHVVAPDFFATLRIATLAGRTFEQRRADDVADMSAWTAGHAVADFNVVIDRRLAGQLGFEDPARVVGRTLYRVTSRDGSTPRQRLHVVGVVEDALLRPMSLGYGGIFVMNPQVAVVPLVRISPTAVPAALAGIDAIWRRLAPEVPIKRRFADEQFEQAFGFLQAIHGVFTGLAAFAGVIAVMGLVAMALHVIRRRTREIGVRKTLGASVPRVLMLLLRNFSKPVLIANLAAWPLAYVLMSAYLGLFGERKGLSPLPFVASLMLSLLVAWLAVIAQATRAARVQPAAVLRHE